MRLEITYEDKSTEVVSIYEKSFVVGRGRESDLRITSQGISRKHLRIEIEQGDVFVTDLNSANGVYIDGEKIEPNTKTPFTTYFPIVMGKNIQLSLLGEEDPREIGPEKGHASRATFSMATGAVFDIPLRDETKTTVLPHKPPLARRSSSNTKKTNEKKQSSSSSLIVLVLIALAAYGYYNPDQIKTFLKSLAPEGAFKDEVSETIEQKVEDSSHFTRAFSQEKCKSDLEKEFCEMTEVPLDQNEGVTNNATQLYVVVNTKKQLDYYALKHKSDLLKDKKEELLIYTILTPKLRELLEKHKELKYISVLGFKLDEFKIPILEVAYKVSIKDSLRLTSSDVDNIYQFLFTKNDSKYYDKYIKPLIVQQMNF